MQIVRFTKFWEDLDIEAMGARALELGYDGLDLAVRDGHVVHPGNVEHVLPRAVAHWRSLGLDCPLVSAQPSLTEPAAARPLFEAAAAAGVPNIKIGYFQYRPGADFEQSWANAREQLRGFAALARETDVRAIYHTHSGLCLGSNCAGLRHLLGDLDPRDVGAYVDLGHLAVNGEDVRMGFAMLAPYLAAVSAKDAYHRSDPALAAEGRGHRREAFVLLGQGAAQLEPAFELLRGWAFQGPVSIHTEYTDDPSVIATVGGKDLSTEARALRERGEVHDLEVVRRLASETPAQNTQTSHPRT